MWSDDDDAHVIPGSGSDDESVGPLTDPEVWQDYTSEFTVAAYHELQEFFARLGVPVLDKCAYSDFADFCFRHSSGWIPEVDAPFPAAPYSIRR
jgi:hypothetical protein